MAYSRGDLVDVTDPSCPPENLLWTLARYKFASRQFKPTDLVGDFACGRGLGTTMMARKCAKVIGLDIDPDKIDRNKKFWKDAVDHYTKKPVDNVEFVVGDLLKLDQIFPESAFNAIVSIETVEHVAYEAGKLIVRNFSKILRPGGFLCLSTPQYDKKRSQTETRKTEHPHEFTQEELLETLEACFRRVFLFSQNDEFITSASTVTAWHFFALAVK